MGLICKISMEPPVTREMPGFGQERPLADGTLAELWVDRQGRHRVIKVMHSTDELAVTPDQACFTSRRYATA
jgi:hypothetical protein